MKILVFGAGYVGLTTAVALAEKKHTVTCVDLNSEIVNDLNNGVCHLFEENLQTYLKKNLLSGHLFFTDTPTEAAVDNIDIIFIAVGTPANEDGSVNIGEVWAVIQDLCGLLNSNTVIALKSTVPMGTCQRVEDFMNKTFCEKGKKVRVDVASNPEFLREGLALYDAFNPQRIVIGSNSKKATEMLSSVYEPFINHSNQLIILDSVSAEFSKYAANAMLAARISLMNELARLCERVGADIEQVRQVLGSDSRIGPEFLRAGIGFGGACLPKDLSALIHMGNHLGESMALLRSVESTNTGQLNFFFNKIQRQFDGNLRQKRIAIWGAAFKPKTNDIRQAPALSLMKKFIENGASITVYDPVVGNSLTEFLGESPPIAIADDPYSSLGNAEALCLVTEWEVFKNIDWKKVKELMKLPNIYDGRNFFDPEELRKLGFNYFPIGRA